MLPRYIGLAALLVAVVLGAAARAEERGRPVTFAVVDAETRRPVEHFRYQSEVRVPGQGGKRDTSGQWNEVESAAGTFVVEAPSACAIEVKVQARGYVDGHGFPGPESFEVKSSDVERKFQIEMHRGVTVRGKVIDEGTGKPISGAVVMPVIFLPPTFTGDRERVVRSKEDGSFEVEGVDRDHGIEVSHDDYLPSRLRVPEANGATLDAVVKLSRGETLRGIVHDTEGRPLAGVKVTERWGKEAVSDADGGFALSGVRRRSHAGNSMADKLRFECDGFDDLMLIPTDASKPMDVTMQRYLVVAGRVVDPSGGPVQDYLILAGREVSPAASICTNATVHDQNGAFRVPVKRRSWQEGDDLWLGICADGYAPVSMQLKRGSIPTDLVVKLSEGSSMTGQLVGPIEGRSCIARVYPYSDGPRSGDEAVMRSLALRDVRVPVGADGRFRVEHLEPGRYTLLLSGQGITPVVREVVVREGGVDIGKVPVQRAGRLTGVVSPGGGVQPAFAKGVVRVPWVCIPDMSYIRVLEIAFTADEEGRFVVEDVPAGPVEVVFRYYLTADITGAMKVTAEVKEGKTTEVSVSDADRLRSPRGRGVR